MAYSNAVLARLVLLVVLASIGPSQPALATLYLGAMGGADVATQSGAATSPAFAGTIGLKFGSYVGLGLFGSYTSAQVIVPVIGTEPGTQVILGGELNLFLGGLHLGGDFGFAQVNASGGFGISNSDVLVYGPELGYDLVLGRVVSIGAEGHVFFSNSSVISKADVQVLGALKLWLF